MKRLQEFARRLFSLRNVAPLLIIIGAVIGGLGLTPLGIQFKAEQVIMALLAFLAIDSLVERLDLLTNIEQGVASIQKTLTPKVTADVFFKRRKNFPRMEQLINEARSDIWIAGVSLDTMVTLISTFESKLKQGCRIRFLALAPEGEALQVAAKYHATEPTFWSTRIKSNLVAIGSRLKSAGNGSVEIRVLDGVFPTGYFITDPNSHKGQMIVQLYLYHLDSEETPLFELSKSDDKQWFALYMTQFERAWNDAIEFQITGAI